ncbi:Sugar-specific transcriptional regulator TrmB [Halomicrobium zhouii]|uniref:Sugar-specific transcriptional regulator TrmB n=1 Tax=Halomicrobium zhouii TaxID=767519 RepID=A0A1I6L5E1_9EURY|nr:helix-turn-helix domain-containing protein [Halomicrobium zhouii]SFR98656.1 Sugar-specific transcriptional regulator TrmB [Halomicrobium zhouii]
MSDLTELGLSSYEEQAYRALLTLGPATAQQVSETSDVPKGRVYDVLNALAARDLVEVRAGAEPRQYAAADPDEAVDRLLDERRADLRDERARYEQLAADVSAELSTAVPSESRFWPIPLGSEDAVAGMGEQFDAAEASLLSVVAAPYEGAALEAYRDEIDAYADLVRTGLEVKLLTTPALIDRTPSDQLARAVADAPDFAVRTTTGINLTYDVLDRDAVYLSVPTPFTDGERLGAVLVRDDDLADRLEGRFREAWAAAEPVEPAVAGDD